MNQRNFQTTESVKVAGLTGQLARMMASTSSHRTFPSLRRLTVASVQARSLGNLQWQVLRRVLACLTVRVTSECTALLNAEVLPCGLGHCATLAEDTTWHAEQCRVTKTQSQMVALCQALAALNTVRKVCACLAFRAS